MLTYASLSHSDRTHTGAFSLAGAQLSTGSPSQPLASKPAGAAHQQTALSGFQVPYKGSENHRSGLQACRPTLASSRKHSPTATATEQASPASCGKYVYLLLILGYTQALQAVPLLRKMLASS